MDNQNLTSAYSQRNIIVNSNDAIETDQDSMCDVRRMEVWRPFSQIKPKDGTVVLVKTRDNYFYKARMIDGELSYITHASVHSSLVPVRWIPYPYNSLLKYYSKQKMDIPLETMFGYLLEEKHIAEDKLNKLSQSGKENASKAVNNALQVSEAKIANLNEIIDKIKKENSELQDLIATRNDELTKADSELEECYVTIAELKRQLKDATSEALAASEHRINELSVQISDCTVINKQLNKENNDLRNANEQNKKKIREFAYKIEELKKNPKPVITLAPDSNIQYLAKYNILSTQFTKMRNLVRDILARCVNTSRKGGPTPEDIREFNVRLKNITEVTPKPQSTETSTTPVSSASPTENTAPVKPRRITIPRINFLKIPHVGEGTITLIEPLLNRFNVFMS